MRRMSAIFPALATVISAAAGVIATAPIDYPSLRELPGVSARAINRDASDVTVDEELQRSLREQLSAAGIPLLPYSNNVPGHPELILWVAEDHLELELTQDVLLARSASVKVRAATWRSLRARPDPSTRHIVPDYLMREFVTAWTTAHAVRRRPK